MNKSTNVNIRMDADTKQRLDALLSSAGLNISIAVNAFARQCILENKLPFEIKFEVPNEETRMAMTEAEKGKGLSKAYDNLDEMWSDLNV